MLKEIAGPLPGKGGRKKNLILDEKMSLLVETLKNEE